MSTLTVEMANQAYLLMHLHSIKYHNFDCCGLLVGRKHPDTKRVVVEGAVPLFHQRLMTATTEVAFEMVETLLLEPDQHIIGIYEAALPSSLSGGREQSHLA